jgi:hypothetical protein
VNDRWFLICVVATLFIATACGRSDGISDGVSDSGFDGGSGWSDVGHPSQDVRLDSADGGLDTSDDGRDSDVGSIELNGCGGTAELRFEGEAAAPRVSCGECDDGKLVCDGPDDLTCLGASPVNACGGCGELAGDVGEACGVCRDGAMACQTDGTLACEGASEPNACGGCGMLDGAPGSACDRDGPEAGAWSCASPDKVRCVSAEENACGGTGDLANAPLEPCGACNRGVIVCNGKDDVRCEDDDRGLNECGGCAPLLGQLGEGCGVCDGEWVCAGGDDVVCDDPGQNVCGGCTDTGDGAIDRTCPDGSVRVCQSMDDLVCDPEAANACGGSEQLDALPGDPCGPCGTGHVVCASTNSTACIGQRSLNACGGCGLLAGEPGQSCGPRAVWRCTSDEWLECALDDDTNACGGSSSLTNAPGEACGPCDLDVIVCDGGDSTTCSGDTECPELDVATAAATGITDTGATFHGELLELPLDEVIDHGFCYGSDPAPDFSNATCTSLGGVSSPQTFSQTVQDLLPGRLYRSRAYATTRRGTTYGYSESFTTVATEPVVSATQGDYRDHVRLEWTTIDGAQEYVIYRDGAEIGRAAHGEDSYDDTMLGSGWVQQPQNVDATRGDHFDRVTVSWDPSMTGPGPSHTYTLVAIYPHAASAPSAPTTGFVGPPEIVDYEVAIYHGGWQSVGLVTTWDDMSAPEPHIEVPQAQATEGEHADRVALDVDQLPAVIPGMYLYEVQAVIHNGSTSGPSRSVFGYRGAGDIEYQWERSSGDSDADYADLGGATSSSFDDTTAPDDGSGRFYRLRLMADNAADEHTEAVRGFRAAPAELTTLAAADVDETSATLHAEIDDLGAPAPTAHGFCYGTTSNPTHGDVDVTCTDLGSATTAETFSESITGLAAGTEYHVQAFAENNAGRAYGEQGVSFWTTSTQTP